MTQAATLEAPVHADGGTTQRYATLHRRVQARPLGHRPRRDPRALVRLRQEVPARRPVARERARVPAARREALPLADPGPHLREHVRAGRALHRREDPRARPRPRDGRPGRARGAGAPDRRGAQAPGAVPPPRVDGGRAACRAATGFVPRRPTTSPATVLGKSTWAVLALTLDIEIFTQVHYRSEHRVRTPTSRALWKDVFLFHWKEESQHAILDELEWRREHARLDAGGARRARSTT